MKLKKLNTKFAQPKDRINVWFAAFGILGIVICSQLVLTSLLADKGEEVARFEARASSLARENENLRREVSNQTSLANVSKQAESLGLIRTSSIIYIDLSSSVASLQ